MPHITASMRLNALPINDAATLARDSSASTYWQLSYYRPWMLCGESHSGGPQERSRLNDFGATRHQLNFLWGVSMTWPHFSIKNEGDGEGLFGSAIVVFLSFFIFSAQNGSCQVVYIGEARDKADTCLAGIPVRSTAAIRLAIKREVPAAVVANGHHRVPDFGIPINLSTYDR
jgi:hypothetical protein